MNYAKESLDCYRKITEAVEQHGVTHLIGLGDFTYGRFNTLEYREAVETELVKQYKLVNGNHYELKGNHDSAGYGMTEYEYYIKKGLLNPSCNMTIGNVHFTMVDYGKTKQTAMNFGEPDTSINVVLAHDYYRFKDSLLPNYGKCIELDNLESWFGADYLICGHIHNQHAFNGLIVKDIDGQPHGHRMMVQYPGALTRPSYREGAMDEIGQLILLVIRDNGEMEYNVLDVDLLPLGESFNLAIKQIEKEKKAERQSRVDLSDIIKTLEEHNRNIGDPKQIIMSMDNIDDKYKNKAIELLDKAMS